jgi:hypothetical protein
MNSKGMVAGLLFAWGNEGYQSFRSPEQYQQYIRYLVARYASKNVFWIIAGEFEEANVKDTVWISYMNTIAENDPYGHPSTMHTVNTTDRFGNVPTHTVIGQQRKGPSEYLAGLIAKSRVYGKPVVNLEYGYESTTAWHRSVQTTDEVRQDHYAIVLAGGYGVYGNDIRNFSTYHKYPGFRLDATDTLGARQLTMLYNFFTKLKFWELVPAQQLTDKGICAYIPDSDYLVEILTGGTVTLDLTNATGEFKVDWFDPKLGKVTPGGATTGGAKQSFTSPATPPGQQITDWILHLHR